MTAKLFKAAAFAIGLGAIFSLNAAAIPAKIIAVGGAGDLREEVRPSNAAADFIFVAEVPVYTQFQTNLSIDELLEKEYAHFTRKSKRSSVSMGIKNYIIEDATAATESKSWRGAVKLYKKERDADDVLNAIEDNQILTPLIKLFETEAFGTSPEESRLESDEKLRLVLLSNRIKSIFSVKNQSLKVPSEYKNTLVLKGAWEPKWVEKRTNSPVKVEAVRSYLHMCIQNAMDSDLSDTEHKEWLAEITKLIKEEAKVTGHVPYHELREHLRRDPARNRFVTEFISRHPDARLYEATHDSDLVRLRIAPDKRSIDDELLTSTGLYTHYLDALRHLRASDKPLPNILTTGYRLAYERHRFKSKTEYAWLYQAIEEERYVRAAASTVDFRATYIPEPNCLYLVPKGSVSISYGFMLLPNGNRLKIDAHNEYAPCESMAILRQMYSADPTVTVHFDPTHPVLMKTPPRMLINKHSKTPHDVSKLGSYDSTSDRFEVSSKNLRNVLSLSSSISQSSLTYRDYSVTLYRQLGLNGSSGIKYNMFRSLVPTIFNYFDIKNWNVIDDHLEPLSVLEWGDIKEQIEHKLLLSKLDLIKSKKTAEEQLDDLKTFMNEVFAPKIGDIIIKLAKLVGGIRQNHHSAFIQRDATALSLRTSPRQAIDQSLTAIPARRIVIKLSKREPTVSHTDTTIEKASIEPSSIKSLTAIPVRRIVIKLSKREPTVSHTDTTIEKASIEPSSIKDPFHQYIESFFQQDYKRELVTVIVKAFPVSASKLAKYAQRDKSMIYKLKNPEKYGPLDPTARIVWGLFHKKSIDDINKILEINIKELETLAIALGYDKPAP